MTNTEILGYIAMAMTTSSFVPQAITTLKTRDVSGISLPTYAILTIGLFMWLVYGWLRNDPPIVIANAIMFVLTGSIMLMKIIFSKPKS